MQKMSGVSVLVLGLSVFATAQQSPTVEAPPLQPQAMSSSRPAASDHKIKLDVVVTDHAGKPVSGLQQQAFSILDNKQPRPILSFNAETGATLTPDATTEVVLVMDEVNTSFQRVSYERDEIKKFLGANEGKLAYPVSLVFFTDLGTQIQAAPTRDGNALIASLDKNENGLRTIRRSTGIYGAEDRVQLSLKTLTGLAATLQPKPGRKMIIWISPGWPLLSGPRIELSNKDAQGIFNSVVNISTALRQARIALYSVDPLGLADIGGTRTTYYEEFLKGLNGPNQAQIADLSLQVIATQSGGKVLYGSNSIVNGIETCTQDLNSFYVLTMDAVPADRANEYHALQVKVATPGLTARTRYGYYAQP
jgi:VWFA-related protein